MTTAKKNVTKEVVKKTEDKKLAELVMNYNQLNKNTYEETLIKKNEIFEAIYNQTKSIVIKNIKRQGIKENDLNDVVQEVYEKIYKNLNRLEDANKAFGWIKQIAVNTAINYRNFKVIKYESTLKEYNNEDSNKTEDIFNSNDYISLSIKTPEDYMLDQYITKTLTDLIQELPKFQQSVISFFYFNNLRIKEIAEILNVNENKVKKTLYMGRKNLKDKILALEKEEEDRLYCRSKSYNEELVR
jgi:RNA polymerase sigma-70 factor (ECF subfamily)